MSARGLTERKQQLLRQIAEYVNSGATNKEIAEHLGKPIGGISQFVFQARRAGYLKPIARRRHVDSGVLVLLSQFCEVRLRLYASEHEMSHTALAERILEAVCKDNLFSAILED